MAYLDLTRIGGTFGVRAVDKVTGIPRESFTYSDNVVTHEGLDKLLNVFLSTHTKITAWYIGLKSTTQVESSCTYAVPIFTESTHYTEATRVAWTEDGSTARSIDNSTSVATFTIGSTVSIKGAFLVGGGTAASTKGDTLGGGTLFSVANFSAAKPLSSGDSLEVTYTFTATYAT